MEVKFSGGFQELLLILPVERYQVTAVGTTASPP